MLGRQGFTLVEVMIGLGLTVLVAAMSLQIFLYQHWTGLAQVESAASQATLRTGMLFLSSELRELGGTAGDTDLLTFAPESLTYRAARGSGLSCWRSAGSVAIQSASLTGYRAIQPGRDSLWIHHEGKPATAADDRWLPLPVLGTGTGNCGGLPAVVVATVLDTISAPIAGFALMAPVHSFEIMQVRLYQSGGDYWLGARSVSAGETIQPVLGPLAANGLAVTGVDSAGVPTMAAAAIRRLDIILRTLTSVPVRRSGSGTATRRMDSLRFSVTLRNR